MGRCWPAAEPPRDLQAAVRLLNEHHSVEVLAALAATPVTDLEKGELALSPRRVATDEEPQAAACGARPASWAS